MLNSGDEQYRGIYFFGMFYSHLILPNIRHLTFFFYLFTSLQLLVTWKNSILKGEIKLNYSPHSTKFILRIQKAIISIKSKTTIDTTFTWLTREDFWTLSLPGLHWTECYFQRCEQRDCGVEFQPVCLCVGRATSPSRRATLSPRAAPRGWWIPRSQSEPSAPSMRPPFSEWTFPLPPPSHPTLTRPVGLASPCLTHLPPPPVVCLSLWHSGPDPHTPLLSATSLSATACVSSWKLHSLPDFGSTLSKKYILTRPLNFPTSFCLHLFSSWITLFASRTPCTVLSLSPSPPTIDSRW